MKPVNKKSMSIFDFIRILISQPYYRKYFLASSVLFFFIYLFANGMAGFLPFSVPPYISILLDGPIGEVPWINIYFYRFMISINFAAGVSSVLISTLFGLNIAGIIYIYKSPSCPDCKINIAVSGVSTIPAFFALFSCCGGGLAIAFLILLGASNLIAGALLPYSLYFVLVSILLLSLNLIFVYRRARGVII